VATEVRLVVVLERPLGELLHRSVVPLGELKFPSLRRLCEIRVLDRHVGAVESSALDQPHGLEDLRLVETIRAGWCSSASSQAAHCPQVLFESGKVFVRY
jgi:hypothetical protein